MLFIFSILWIFLNLYMIICFSLNLVPGQNFETRYHIDYRTRDIKTSSYEITFKNKFDELSSCIVLFSCISSIVYLVNFQLEYINKLNFLNEEQNIKKW